MKNWKFIKVGNSDKEFKSEQELRRWAIDNQYTYKPTHGGYYMLEDDSGKGREPIEAHVSQPVVNKTGNESILTKDGLVNYPDKEIGEINILKRELEGLMRMAEKDKSTDYSKQIEALKKEISEKKNKYALGNKKTGNKRYFDVEEEGGDSRSFPSLSEARKFADKWRSEGKQTIHIFEIEENDKDPDDFRIVRTHNESINKQTWSMFKGLAKDAEKEVGNKVGNAGHWNSSKTMYAKWDDATGRPADEYAVITWLGEGKGGLVNIWKGHQMTSEKYGSNDLSDLRRWAEQRIGNAAVASEVVARDVVDGKEYIVEKTSLRNGQDVQFNLYYSMDGSGKRHAGVFKDKDSAVSAGKKIVGNETAEEKKFGHVMREFDRGELKSSSGETVTNPEQAKAIAYSESEKVKNLKRARNSMTKNAMGVSDLEAQIKKNKEFIRQQKMRMNGKSKPEQDDIAEGIREAQDEIDRMEMRIAELKEQGNNKKA